MTHFERFEGSAWPPEQVLDLVDPGVAANPDAYQQLDMGVIAVELQEQSEREGRMVDLGTLSDGTDPSIWKGAASLAARLQNGELTADRVEQHVAKLGRHFVPVTQGAPRRCVDDRGVPGFDPANPDPYVLGPQQQGATVEEAYTDRLTKITQARKAGRPAEVTTTIADDVVAAMDRPSGFAPGAHRDDHHAPGKTGCGLADTMQAKNERIATEPLLIEAAAAKTEAVLGMDGRQTPDGHTQDLVASANTLAQNSAYFSTMERAFEQIAERSPNGVPVLTGTHLAGSVTINWVRDTTFNTSAYIADTQGELNNFGFDAWAVADQYGPEQAATIIADAVITLSQLTDGSMRLLARLPQEQQES